MIFISAGFFTAIFAIFMHIFATGKNCFLGMAEPMHETTKKDVVIIALILLCFVLFLTFFIYILL